MLPALIIIIVARMGKSFFNIGIQSGIVTVPVTIDFYAVFVCSDVPLAQTNVYPENNPLTALDTTRYNNLNYSCPSCWLISPVTQ